MDCNRVTSGDVALSLATTAKEKYDAVLKRLDDLEKRVEELEWQMTYYVIDAEE